MSSANEIAKKCVDTLVPEAPIHQLGKAFLELEAELARTREALAVAVDALKDANRPRRLRDTGMLMSYPPQNAAVWDIQVRVETALARIEAILRGEK
jgi:hypothetical protein